MLSIVQAIRSTPKRVIAGTVLALTYGAVAGTFTTFTRPAEVATFLPGVAAVVVALVRAPAAVPADRRFAGWIAWAVLVVIFTATELVALAAGANHAHPTISDLVNPWIDHDASRAAGFTLWLGFGYWLVRR
jgi:hypothetical protein